MNECCQGLNFVVRSIINVSWGCLFDIGKNDTVTDRSADYLLRLLIHFSLLKNIYKRHNFTSIQNSFSISI